MRINRLGEVLTSQMRANVPKWEKLFTENVSGSIIPFARQDGRRSDMPLIPVGAEHVLLLSHAVAVTFITSQRYRTRIVVQHPKLKSAMRLNLEFAAALQPAHRGADRPAPPASHRTRRLVPA